MGRYLAYLQVMYVQGLVIAYMIFQIVRKLFFGELRAAEYEVKHREIF